MEKIIECIPNFSEGKDLKKIQAIVDEILSVPEIKLLDQTSDFDHNRSVITFIGPPQAVLSAAFKATKKATKLIKIHLHEGVHPRIGATDVLPLVPLKNVTIEECIKYAEELGKKIGEELKIPVILYGYASTTKENERLENVRKNADKIAPDFGPAKPKSAGITALGVRDILIAFNINLKTSDLKIAKTIAKEIRESSGGLPFVKALGLKLGSKNITQISMNLTNYKVTSPLKVFKLVKKLAKKYRTEIIESELIGLIPKDALPKKPEVTIKLHNYTLLPHTK